MSTLTRWSNILVRPIIKIASCPLAFLATAYQHLWQFLDHGSYVDSHVFTIPPSLASYRMMLAVLVALTGSSYPFGRSTLSEQLHTGPLPVSHVLLGYDGRNRRFHQVAI